LQSIGDPEKDSNDDKKEEENNIKNPPTKDSAIIPTKTLDTNDAASSGMRTVHLSVDFGDFDIIPLDELSCPICLVDYVHGDVVQRNAFNGCNDNHIRRNPNTTSMSMNSNHCNHIFHRNCIMKWMQSNFKNECPICRQVFREGFATASGISQK
jgi:hypothetical protein